ncbi:hypothetical protein NCS57_00051600 [Fusarium keratoplasticum]|uniref:Uncharacterized protein n=1 Tax=Fusarium keratoplasticum TaxID=1328300 RepID=A0ACC0RFT2_9HYPO|nr:hypothetical protein NCS57_00051600 [Fusarium keratoplasticum]KAI8683868.1 hypothetical protein NCS57_00051600 [Fusarium keratoplasticum]KAI8687981.1 hypothetical protein NCS55_00050600 [Fusarium keratoplasticum]
MSSGLENIGANALDVTLTQAASGVDHTNHEDVDMTDQPDNEDSDASSYDPAAALFDKITQSSGTSGNKRKSPGSKDPTQPDNVKRVRLQEDGPGHSRELPSSTTDRAKQLPAGIWQHIFTLVSPKTLGRLLSVNKLFHSFLTPSSSTAPLPHRNDLPSALPYMKPEAIWQASRRLFCPRMPAPLKGKSELHMWRLICSTTCQFCGSKGDLQSFDAADEWHRGPGAKGVSPIFPFSVCTCGTCLVKRSTKELDVLLSSTTPSLLLPALPPIFVTDQLHVLRPRVMQTGVLPPNTQVTKFYWSEHINQIKNEFEQVKVLGSAATEEWVKGLEIRGKQALADASRWEKWELAGGLNQVRVSLSATKPDPPKAENLVPVAFSPKPLPGHHLSNLTRSHEERQDKASNPNEIPSLAGKLDAPLQQPRPLGQQKRTKEEVAQLKAQRRADIERRAMLLDPPLTASVLAHIPSFQAALQLITPLDDNAWELLKPRLLAQRSDAEVRERENTANARALQDKLVTQNGSKPAREPREVPDQEWDDIQGPVRARISAYADEIIKGWNNGEKVKRKNTPQFAADVLLYVRKRFYAEVAKDTAAAVAAGKEPIVEPPEGPWTQKLTLENMKWVFDMKVKPRTEQFRKELFLCNGCNPSGNLKFFGFEGVIQHYAAKHTGVLSLGNVVVHWRAEWPAVPPFSPDPRAIELGQYGKSSSHSLPQTGATAQQGFAGYQPAPPAGYGPPGYSAPFPAPPLHYSSGPPVTVPPTDYGGVGPHAYGAPYSSAAYPGSMTYSSYPPQFSSGAAYGSYGQTNAYVEPHTSGPASYDYGSYPNLEGAFDSGRAKVPYKTRLNAMAKIAKDTWFKLGGVKKLHPSIKVSTVIHRIAKKFQKDYDEAASLSMFAEALSSHKDMRAVRVANDISCKACTSRRGFTLVNLVTHFMAQHVEGPEAQGLAPMDWRVDMVSLPDEACLAKVKRKLQNNQAAHAVVEDAIPWAFEKSFIDRFLQQGSSEEELETTPVVKPGGKSDKNPAGASGGHGTQQRQTHEAPEANDRPQQQLEHRPGPQSSTEKAPGTSQPLPRAQPQAQAYDKATEDIPHLRPASEVYGGHKKKRTVAVQGQPTTGISAQERPLSDRQPASESESAKRTERREVKAKAEDESNNTPSTSARPRNPTHWRDERSHDYRDAREQRYSIAEPSGPRDRSASVGNRPQEYRPPIDAPVNAASGFIEARRGSRQDRPTLENHGHAIEEEVVYVDESGREIGRGMRARDTLPQETRYGVPDGRVFDDHRYAPSSWYEGHDPARFRTRSPLPRYGQSVHHYEAEPAPHRVYYDYHDHRATVGPGAYEYVEVRSQYGDYFIRRPVQHDERDFYTYDTRPPMREQSAYPAPRAAEGHLNSRYAADPRASVAPGRAAARPEFDDYDPRYPSPGKEEDAYQGNQRL